MANIYIFEIDIKINTGKNRNFSMWKKKILYSGNFCCCLYITYNLWIYDEEFIAVFIHDFLWYCYIV
jgi:predicted adenine nucleotide alpha hydrolase (AANH) superfamily ATPase